MSNISTEGGMSTVDAAEIAKFSRLSAEWWDPDGRMAPLHRINPPRLTFIRDAVCRRLGRNSRSLDCFTSLRVIDIGCGAGLLCEPLARLGADVVGIDPSVSNIEAARLHARRGDLLIDYRCGSAEDVSANERFDVVLAMEVVEHVANVGIFVRRCASMLRPGGILIAATLNRNWKSFALAIVGAEYVLRWLPRGTHDWNRFVTPDEFRSHLRDSGLTVSDQSGLVYSPIADRWRLSADMDVNYMIAAVETDPV
ncbi:MAG: bifunctional 2-polyprenyl-6-hydroxyphenol methylase/3-demethylubiquinol 3-O-methyltransferase UbiG [Alphaproteobacteria bacterium]|nr:bifunctional 2-polyprenyl-6-hydroxyphenol methylase/3-demethylubiquinol 3-O-methyltransferase UbiG [Alphaproteobacteria bacterium]